MSIIFMSLSLCHCCRNVACMFFLISLKFYFVYYIFFFQRRSGIICKGSKSHVSLHLAWKELILMAQCKGKIQEGKNLLSRLNLTQIAQYILLCYSSLIEYTIKMDNFINLVLFLILDIFYFIYLIALIVPLLIYCSSLCGESASYIIRLI